MVGEIRDLETGEIAIKAAQTGHMVLSTLHTNDAPSTLTRLMNMGIAPFNIASCVILITAQRLAQASCAPASGRSTFPKEALLRAGFTDERPGRHAGSPTGTSGCDICKNTGYKGRVGIYQVMPITDEMQRIIMKNGTAIDIAEQARKEGVSRPAPVGLAQGQGGPDLARRSRGRHQRVAP